MNFKTGFGIAAGGFAGTLCRYGLSQLSMKWSTVSLNILVINLLGAFLLAVFLEISLERLSLSVQMRTGISTGFLGAFTTFSGLCSEAFSLIMANGAGVAGLYLAISMIGGMFAAFAGVAAARMLADHSGESHG